MRQAFKVQRDIPHNIEKTVNFTGHRPTKLGGYAWNRIHQSLYDKLIKFIAENISTYDTYISGMALGVDTIGAKAVLTCRDNYGLPVKLVAALPYLAQTNRWRQESINEWNMIKDLADCVVEVSENPKNMRDSIIKLQIRNEWMVDKSALCIGIWDGSKGGTRNCLEYARKKGRLVYQINPNSL
jgi:uncharacterized phage-like protein YoqJ